jgi:hypothetical protein
MLRVQGLGLDAEGPGFDVEGTELEAEKHHREHVRRDACVAVEGWDFAGASPHCREGESQRQRQRQTAIETETDSDGDRDRDRQRQRQRQRGSGFRVPRRTRQDSCHGSTGHLPGFNVEGSVMRGKLLGITVL